MRHVSYKAVDIKYPQNWNNQVAVARLAVETAKPNKRSEIIEKYQNVWACLKSELAKVFYGKCWYTEAPQAGTDTDVDHFRPKKAVKGVKNPATRAPHPGYWWQAFDPTNFRYSCIVANRRRRDLETGRVGGKADEFPLWEEKKRAWKPQDDCNEEQPLLLDPCNPADVALITFAENGEAIPRYSEQDKPRLYARAKKSEELYHLNHSDFVKARINIRVQLEKLIEDSERYYRKLDNGDATNDYAYMRAIVQLREACSEKAPFSSFALAYLQPYRTKDSLEPVFR